MSRVTLLRDVELFACLSDGELEALAERLGRRTFGKGVILFHKDSPGQTLYLVESGQVRIFLLSESGQEISLNLYGPGQCFGEMALLDGLPRSAGAVTLERTVVHTLHRRDFSQCLERYPCLAQTIIELLCARLRYTTAYAESLAFLDVHGRVATRLLELADRYGVEVAHGEAIELRLTQADLAGWVAATRESVNKVLSTFRDGQLIQVDGQRITVLDRRGLAQQIRY
jgi:CRP/FNR family transcriptional regulator/CRP/FNR family cyclic AMP-dependent transcriptional regulator